MTMNDEENGEVYEGRLSSRVRIGCLYFIVGWIVLSVVAFFLMVLWDRFAGGPADGEIPSIPMVF
jgi:hypothetical protein